MTKVLALFVALTISGLASAGTDCTSRVESITVETGSKAAGTIVVLESGLSFAIMPSSVNAREVMNMASMAQFQERGVMARFAADGVDCTRGTRRTDLIAIQLRPGEERTTTVTPPPSATSTVKPPTPK